MHRPLRFLVFALLSFAFVSEAAAQTEQPPIRFSVAGGINVSRLTFPLQVGELPFEFNIDIDNGSRIGLVAGGLVDFRVAPGVGVLTGGLFSTRGGNLEIDLSDLPEIIPDPGVPFPVGPLEIDLRMTYLDVPAFVTVDIAGTGPHRVEVIGGGMLGIKTGARFKLKFGGVSVDESFSSGLPAADFGVSIGGRYSCGHIFAAAYYTWGLTDLAEGDGPESIKHRYLTVIGGWRF